MCFFIKDEQFLEKYNEIVENVSNRIKKTKINSEPGRNKKYLKTEIKCYRGKSTEKRLPMYLYIRSIN